MPPKTFPNNATNVIPRSYFLSDLKILQSAIDPSTSLFKLGIVTDSHYDENTWRTQAYRSYRNLNNILYIQNNVDAIAALGDNVDSEHKEKAINIANLERFCERFSEGINKEKFIIRGNHDMGALVWDTQNAGNKVFAKDVLTGPEQLNIFKKYFNQEGKVYGSEGQYHYKDYPDKKVRLVFIDTLDNSMATNSNGTLKYVDQWNYGIQNTQLNWIASEALGVLPDDFHVLILSHVPIMPDSVTSDPITNSDILKKILNAFVNRSNGTFTSSEADFQASVTVDYRNRQQ
ncbi:metallophosphoesterase, partial [Enterococcus avium]|nr:metallophosphoesterase [Enterococcus avium]